ncbi:MAG: cytochrome c biogenesis heme-transporting ATPase CcmA [Pseudomonadales bacterium]|nr:cytochrome c biogenesis heme-transporting ATPase CcmA [Pseudomonadales bacterium]
MSHSPLLSVKQLSCQRGGVRLFHNLAFELASGELLQLAGPNGVGKSSLLKILAGLSTQYEGKMYWRGQKLARRHSVYEKDLLFIGHLSGIKKSLSPLENLRWYFPETEDSKILDALQHVGLAHYEDQPCAGLSAGQQRRVVLARLYLSSAVLWVLDEPFTAIDQKGVRQVEQRILEHIAKGGAALITTHHDLGISARKLDLSDFAVGALT